MNARTLLLGLGNDILTDDAIGLHAARSAGEMLKGRKDIEVRLCSEMGLSLLDEIVGFENLILVDAVQTGTSPPGFVHELGGDDLSVLPPVAPHFLGVGEVLALGRKLELAVPERVKIFAVEVQDVTTVSSRLTPAVRAALPAIVARLLKAVKSFEPTSAPG